MIRMRELGYRTLCSAHGSDWAMCIKAVVGQDAGFLLIDESHDAFPKKGKRPAAAAPAGLGDRVAAVLSAVGITKDRVQAVAQAVGVKDCGCAKRQAALNSWAHKHLGLPPGQTPAS